MNNPDIYNAALSGIAGGICSSRSNPSTNSADYASTANICEAFATEIDSLINTTTITDIMVDSMIQICSGYWINRSPRSIVANSYLTECRQIVALWTAIVAKGA
jgi:hypothetical protein